MKCEVSSFFKNRLGVKHLHPSLAPVVSLLALFKSVILKNKRQISTFDNFPPSNFPPIFLRKLNKQKKNHQNSRTSKNVCSSHICDSLRS